MILEIRRADKRLREAERKYNDVKEDVKAAKGDVRVALNILRDLAGDNADGQARIDFDAAESAGGSARADNRVGSSPAAPTGPNQEPVTPDGMAENGP